MANRLANENSPYLLQHSENPVDWYPWGEEALDKARKEDKPIFLSVGYAACHWCHVMEHESFEDPATAALMNQHFVNIKVDREERPDIDNIYMQAVVALTRQGGWPMSVFLTPDKKPFYGGTYFPPTPRHNLPSFKELLIKIAELWEHDREKILQSSSQITQYLTESNETASSENRDAQLDFNAVTSKLSSTYDWRTGGWGHAPKFPQPMVIEYLLTRASRGEDLALEIAVDLLQKMAAGGMYDVIGGAFARYSVDENWLVPHFEKMLYDNAQLALVYLHAFMLTKNNAFYKICVETLDFVLREMTNETGGFYSSIDADSDGEEGKFYVWSHRELLIIFPNEEDKALFFAAFGISANGNFEGKTILRQVLTDNVLADEFNLEVSEVQEKLNVFKSKLMKERGKRLRPNTDDKVLVFWNALMINAFAQAGRSLKIPKYVQAAQTAGRFLIDNLYQDDRLMRSWRNGKAQFNAYLEDYTSTVLAFIELYQTDMDVNWYHWALKLCDEMVDHFSDPLGGFFDTRDDHEQLLIRPKDLQDNAVPSGNALAAFALLKIAAYGDRQTYHSFAAKMINSMKGNIERFPTAFGKWASAADFLYGPVQQIVLVGNSDSKIFGEMTDLLWNTYRPRMVAVSTSFPPPHGSPSLTSNRTMINGLTTAYVCEGFVCSLPVFTGKDLANQI